MILDCPVIMFFIKIFKAILAKIECGGAEENGRSITSKFPSEAYEKSVIISVHHKAVIFIIDIKITVSDF